ncbi:hypothetical protein [Pontiella sp.]|uniref:hypothetical protein n=1 Tax=Pontiella sp. TaxID=2837462 RepID=UPI003569BA2F
MKTTLGKAAWPFVPLTILLLSVGCATQKYSAARYQAAQHRFGAIELPAHKKLYLCPTIDRIDPRCRKTLDPSFTPWTHATDAFEQELKSSGLVPARPGFAFGPSFDSLKQMVAEKADKSENAVYLGTELLWLSLRQWTVDAVLLSPSGQVLFEKRGICVIYGGADADAQTVTHMAIRQILADPKFKQALL